MNTDNDSLFEKVSEVYRSLGSINDAAAVLGISTVKTRRILITLGLWSSPTSQEIGALYKQGYSVKEIAEKLCITDKNVQAYLPYSKGTYGRNTYDAQMSHDYRERQIHAAGNMVKQKKYADQTTGQGSLNNEGKGMKEMERTTKKNAPDVMKLKLTLEMENMDENEWKILRAYGNVKEGISRTVLIPAHMPLHALHYMINQAFGWQNSHLHRFHLPDDISDDLTDHGSLETWSSLCGIWFRFPSEYDDLYWDDDYKEGESPKSWMRRKYCGPYLDKAYSERYEDCQKEVHRLKKDYAEIEVRESFREMYQRTKKTGEEEKVLIKGVKRFEDSTIEELESAVMFDRNFHDLIEHNSISQIMAPYPEKAEKGKKELAPVTKILHYNYDFGDDWWVTIECMDEYYHAGPFFIDQDGSKVNNAEILEEVEDKEKPVCIEADGLPVMDDAGGIHGYVETLQEIKEEKNPDSRSWARMQGWTGRNAKPENIL